MPGKPRNFKALGRNQRKIVSKMIEQKVSNMAEQKFHDTTATEFPDDAIGDVIPLSDIAQSAGASTDSTRIGDQLNIESIELRLAAAAGVLAGVTTATSLRVLIVQWHGRFSLDPPTTAKIFGAVGSTVASPLRPYNHDNKDMFRVLYDRMLELGYNSDSIHTWKINLKKKLRPTQYYAGSTTDQMDGVYMILQSGVDILGVLPNVTYVSRTTFRDM